ncbi:MAG: molybdopterin-guanine dinucleotide biosynthesis protein B [Synergistaceae bacterium]|jgi:molybdopterin-guanine dinucleotide biosynthesis protein MobB|nr:molybdopterin-guanine dinucleotide biosynthesis protein B [Synergistaceae bacterium]
MRDTGAVVLAGGASRRMGRDKALLRLEGRTFLERIVGSLIDFEEVLLSVGSSRRYEDVRLRSVEDEWHCGPMGGLYSALKVCGSKWLLAVSCDVPLLTREFVQYLVSCVDNEHDAFVPVTRDGRVHPLCAVYSKGTVPVLEAHLAKGDYSVTLALEKMRVKYVSLQCTPYADRLLRNVNTPEQYAALLGDVVDPLGSPAGRPQAKKPQVRKPQAKRPQVKRPQVIAVCGVKNSGKTTLLESVLPILRKQGLRTAVIKHDGHDFTPDVPGTDSFRLREAGAYGTAVYSPHRYMLTVERPSCALEEIMTAFQDADLILLEGGKQMSCPKIEVVRAAISNVTVCPPDSLMGICTDTDIRHPRHTLALDDYEGIAALLLHCCCAARRSFLFTEKFSR